MSHARAFTRAAVALALARVTQVNHRVVPHVRDGFRYQISHLFTLNLLSELFISAHPFFHLLFERIVWHNMFGGVEYAPGGHRGSINRMQSAAHVANGPYQAVARNVESHLY